MVCLEVTRGMLISTVGVNCDLLLREVHFPNTNQLSAPKRHYAQRQNFTSSSNRYTAKEARAEEREGRTRATRSVSYRNARYNEDVNPES